MNKEYIERESAIKITNDLKDDGDSRFYDVALSDVRVKLMTLPAADVVEVRHGYWTGMEGDVCSECYRSLTEIMDADSYFAIGFDPSDLVACPFCGARMDGGISNE